MFQSRSSGKSDIVNLEPARARARPFGRLRPRHEQSAEPPVVQEQIVNGSGVLPIDSAKTFIGPHGTYYDERWRWMEWRGENRSWNWAAALSFGGWMAYRRLYRHAAFNLVWLGLLVLLALHGTSFRFLAVVQLAVAVWIGLYANTWYQQRFRQAAASAAQVSGGHEARLEALAQAGGVDRRAVWLLAAATVGMIALLILIVQALGETNLNF